MLISHRPGPPLSAAIDRIWLSSRIDDYDRCEHMLPTGKAHLIFALHDAPISWAPPDRRVAWHSWTQGIVHGPQSAYYVAGPKPKGSVIGVTFHAGMAGMILGVPTNELQDRHVPIDELWGRRAADLRERLVTATSPQAAIELLERDLIARIQRPLLLHPAVALALRPALSNIAPTVRRDSEALLPAIRVAELQKRSGYSPRHFIELFRSSVGLAPKQFYRIQRFSAALSRIARGNTTLADVALWSGYADQAHLSREFRELAGIAPSVYSPPSPDSEHHHVVDARKR